MSTDTVIRRNAVGKEKTGFVSIVKSCTKSDMEKTRGYWDSILLDCSIANGCQKMFLINALWRGQWNSWNTKKS